MSSELAPLSWRAVSNDGEDYFCTWWFYSGRVSLVGRSSLRCTLLLEKLLLLWVNEDVAGLIYFTELWSFCYCWSNKRKDFSSRSKEFNFECQDAFGWYLGVYLIQDHWSEAKIEHCFFQSRSMPWEDFSLDHIFVQLCVWKGNWKKV